MKKIYVTHDFAAQVLLLSNCQAGKLLKEIFENQINLNNLKKLKNPQKSDPKNNPENNDRRKITSPQNGKRGGRTKKPYVSELKNLKKCIENQINQNNQNNLNKLKFIHTRNFVRQITKIDNYLEKMKNENEAKTQRYFDTLEFANSIITNTEK